MRLTAFAFALDTCFFAADAAGHVFGALHSSVADADFLVDKRSSLSVDLFFAANADQRYWQLCTRALN